MKEQKKTDMAVIFNTRTDGGFKIYRKINNSMKNIVNNNSLESCTFFKTIKRPNSVFNVWTLCYMLNAMADVWAQ